MSSDTVIAEHPDQFRPKRSAHKSNTPQLFIAWKDSHKEKSKLPAGWRSLQEKMLMGEGTPPLKRFKSTNYHCLVCNVNLSIGDCNLDYPVTDISLMYDFLGYIF